MKVADEVARWLEEKTVTHAFGIIGGGNIALWDAVARRGYTTLVTTHHEQGAAMASTYFNRMAGRLGSVALVTTGAGSTNALTGVMAAHMDGVPLLVISGNEASKYLGAHTRIRGVQGYDSAALVDKHATKRASRVARALAIGDLEYHRRLALEAPQGAVWVDFPKDFQNALV